MPRDLTSVYAVGENLPDPLPGDPMPLVAAWLDEATKRGDQPNPNAMTLATTDAEGRPTARIVLCKALEPKPGCVVFYTNYRSAKARDLERNPRACLVFHWDHANRQARVEGPAVRVSPEESDAYFATRPWESRVGAWASDQSEPIGSRAELLEKVRATGERLGIDPEAADPGRVKIDRPEHWGGFRVWAERVELWCGGTGRVHDRARWTRPLVARDGTFEPGPWESTRVQP